MSTKLRVGVIGVGRRVLPDGSVRGGIAYAHLHGYDSDSRFEMVSCADIHDGNAAAFVERYPGTRSYRDYREMLANESLDVVSICTWPHMHAEMAIAAAEAGVRAIHCEKPMATRWGDAKRMAEVCEAKGVQLTIDHQRRFAKPFTEAKALIDAGAIGELAFLEAATDNLYDWGTHWFDMWFYFNEDRPARWVMGQVDVRETYKVFGVELERQGMSQVMWTNGVRGVMFTGRDSDIGCEMRVIGSEGVIEIGVKNGPVLRYTTRHGGGWRDVECGEGLHEYSFFARALSHVADTLESGEEPILSARKALRATEVIFATYESSWRRARVDLPLDIDDSPLERLLAARDPGDHPLIGATSAG